MGAVRRNEGWILAFFGRVRRNGDSAQGVTGVDVGHQLRRLALSAAKPNTPAVALGNRSQASRLE